MLISEKTIVLIRIGLPFIVRNHNTQKRIVDALLVSRELAIIACYISWTIDFIAWRCLGGLLYSLAHNTCW